MYAVFLEFFLERKNDELKFTIEHALGDIENANKYIQSSNDFQDFISKSNIEYKVNNKEVVLENSNLSYVKKYGFTGIHGIIIDHIILIMM